MDDEVENAISHVYDALLGDQSKSGILAPLTSVLAQMSNTSQEMLLP